MSTVDVAALRAAAERATPGPWSVSSQYGQVDVYNPGDAMVAERMWAPNATYIAAANPTTILALLDRLEAAEALAERWAAVLTECKQADPRWILDRSVTTLETALNDLRAALDGAQ